MVDVFCKVFIFMATFYAPVHSPSLSTHTARFSYNDTENAICSMMQDTPHADDNISSWTKHKPQQEQAMHKQDTSSEPQTY